MRKRWTRWSVLGHEVIDGSGQTVGKIVDTWPFDGGEVELVVDRLELSAGEYALDVGVFERDWEYAYDFHSGAYPVRVEGRVAGSGVLLPAHRWIRHA